ncbi:hypothetical protein ID866_6721 [Astraeus odoratus]|nr:hypothetical protein ID866_6721 [Astraeus odoratus]
MRSFNFVAIALTSAVLTSAASSYSRRSVAYLQQNGPAAKALNDQYKSLTASSPCNDGDIACIGDQFASCWDSSYHLYSCPGDWTCAAIPNEWSSGTTTTCDSPDDIAWRFSQAGISEYKRSVSPPKARSIAYLQQNGPAAQALNDKYLTLTTSSSCSDGDIACINGEFASCWDGSYHLYSCPSGWTCAAIPNEWSSGTTTTCDSVDNINWRFAQAGISETK